MNRIDFISHNDALNKLDNAASSSIKEIITAYLEVLRSILINPYNFHECVNIDEPRFRIKSAKFFLYSIFFNFTIFLFLLIFQNGEAEKLVGYFDAFLMIVCLGTFISFFLNRISANRVHFLDGLLHYFSIIAIISLIHLAINIPIIFVYGLKFYCHDVGLFELPDMRDKYDMIGASYLALKMNTLTFVVVLICMITLWFEKIYEVSKLKVFLVIVASLGLVGFLALIVKDILVFLVLIGMMVLLVGIVCLILSFIPFICRKLPGMRKTSLRTLLVGVVLFLGPPVYAVITGVSMRTETTDQEAEKFQEGRSRSTTVKNIAEEAIPKKESQIVKEKPKVEIVPATE